MSTYNRQLQGIANEYFGRKDEGATTREIARWAILNGLWEPTSDLAERRLADDLATAMREEYRTDPQGRQVRAKYSARVKRNGRTENVWDDGERAPRSHMEVSSLQRRAGIVGDCRLLKKDVDSFNENRCPENPIQISFNFTNDLLEAEAAEQAMRKGRAA